MSRKNTTSTAVNPLSHTIRECVRLSTIVNNTEPSDCLRLQYDQQTGMWCASVGYCWTCGYGETPEAATEALRCALSAEVPRAEKRNAERAEREARESSAREASAKESSAKESSGAIAE
jgi:hypothetical protein